MKKKKSSFNDNAISYIKNNCVSIIITAIIYLITLVASTTYFRYRFILENKIVSFICVEILYLTILYIGIKNIINIVKNFKKYKRFVIIFLIYFVINMILLLLVWPGVWRWDELHVALSLEYYVFTGWQHVLTSLYYILALRFIPLHVNIIIMQVVAISLIVSYVVNYLYDIVKIKGKKKYIICLIPFLLPAVLINNLYPLRCILYSYLILLFIFKAISIIKNKNMSYYEAVLFGLLVGLLSTWRSEGIFFNVVILIYSLYFLFKVKKEIIKIALLLSISYITFLGIYMINSRAMSAYGDMSYKLTASIEISAELIRHANKYEENEYYLDQMDRVVDVDLILNSGETGSVLYWNGAVRDGFSKDDFDAYNSAYIYLLKKYPDVFAKQRIHEFNITQGLIKNESNTVGDTTTVFSEDIEIVKSFYKNPLSKPFNNKLRTKVISLFEGRNYNDYYKTNNLYPIIHNLYLPIVLSVIVCLILLIKKQVLISFIYAVSLMKAALVFLTAPSGYFMYYFSDYLLGAISIILLINFIIVVIDNNKAKKARKIKGLL